MDHFPRDRGENTKCLKPPPRLYMIFQDSKSTYIFSCIHIAVSLMKLEPHQKHTIYYFQSPYQNALKHEKNTTTTIPKFHSKNQHPLEIPMGSPPPSNSPWPWVFRTRKEDALETREAFDWALPGRLGLAQGRPSHDRDWGYFTILQLSAHFFFEFVIPLGAAVQSFGFHEKNKKHNLPRKSIPENSSQGIFCLRPTWCLQTLWNPTELGWVSHSLL